MANDRIEREILIAAPPQRVWAVLTETEHIDHWFSQGGPSTVELRPGGLMRLDHGEHGQWPMTIVKVDPPNYLSYRWASSFPGQEATEQNSTLVEFTLIAQGEDATLLQLVESGFEALEAPAGPGRGGSYESHYAGWPGALEGLRQYAEPLPQ